MAGGPPQSLIVTRLSAEPQEETAPRTSRTGLLTEEGLAAASGRVRIAALVSGAVWTSVLVANVALGELFPLWWSEFEGTEGWRAGEPNWIFAALGAVGSFALAWVVPRFHTRPRVILDLGLGLEVFTAALIALISFYVVVPHAARISWVTAVILIYPAIAPAAPRRVLVAGLLAGSMDALGFTLGAFRSPGVQWADLPWMLAPNYVCAFLALVPLTLIRRLGREAGAARELGSYRLGRLIDRGGMGEVYEASHRMIAKPAAIKLIRPDLLSSSPAFADMVIERFYREAEAVAALKSPHTVSLYDFGVATDGTLYYVMELLDGIDLQCLVERFGPLPPARVIHILSQVCDSLGEAHERGMVHRDIKPSNILLCRLGMAADFVKVLDFGLVRREAYAVEGSEGLSTPMGQPGTPSYMAPEAVSGAVPVDRRADIYALGCVGYFLLTGHAVFAGRSAIEIMYHHGYDPPPSPSERLGTTLPPHLDAAILAALAKAPGERPPSMRHFAERLCKPGLVEQWGADQADTWWADNYAAVRMSRSAPDKGRSAHSPDSAPVMQ